MDLLTVTQIAEKLKVKKSWVYSHAHELDACHRSFQNVFI
jgi:hypothetical protein